MKEESVVGLDVSSTAGVPLHAMREARGEC